MKERLPVWFRQEIPDYSTLQMLRLFSEFRVHTVCSEARCPNLSDCFKNKEVTFLILGGVCTRRCKFCSVKKSAQGAALNVDKEEPARVAELVKRIGLDYVVVTSVTRDDLPDGGASLFAQTIELIRRTYKEAKVEALIPDFQGRVDCLRRVLESGPDCLAHNIETVRRLYKEIRPQADYARSLEILRRSKELKLEIHTKSSIMLGLGESKEELIEALKDLRRNNCDCLTLGQYLAPSAAHYPVKRFIDISEFQEYRQVALSMGFKSVLSGPKVRSSYRAKEARQCMN